MVERRTEPRDASIDGKIISEKERQEIIESIEEEFMAPSEPTEDNDRYSPNSLGLKVPLAIAGTVVLITIVVVLLGDKIVPYDVPMPNTTIQNAGITAENSILATFIAESNRKLTEKDMEIVGYQDQIAEYGSRIDTLKTLLQAKEEIEEALRRERERLILSGATGEAIDEYLEDYEHQQLSSYSTSEQEYYKLSVKEINDQITELLDEQNYVRARLEVSYAEMELLHREQGELENIGEEDRDSLAEKLSALKQPLLEDLESRDRQEINNGQIAGFYATIVEDIKRRRFLDASAKISTFKEFLATSSQMEGDTEDSGMTLFHLEMVNILQELVSTRGVINSPTNNTNENWFDAIQAAILGIDLHSSNNIELAEEQLRTALTTIPEIASSYYILSEIERATIENNYQKLIAQANERLAQTTRERDTAIEELREISEKLRVTAQRVQNQEPLPKPAGRGSLLDGNSPGNEEYLFVGVVTSINYNQLLIEAHSKSRDNPGQKVLITRIDASGNETKVGSGTIVEAGGNILTVELSKLSDRATQPQPNDLVYIDNSIERLQEGR